MTQFGIDLLPICEGFDCRAGDLWNIDVIRSIIAVILKFV